MVIETLTPTERITAFLSFVQNEEEEGRAGGDRPVHAGFMKASIGLLFEATMDGRLQKRTGLALGDALTELDALVVRALQQPTSATLIDRHALEPKGNSR